ncbi:esterase [candidate division KSB3 bacterium]|uniref:Esterase n=1 Tax=candidate division KSB3 bacterium TaxID=2044937 RepID=A0A2G6KHN2_9BACT|nr:MAG: esterase [candidate division KSB3 bacterium]
MALIDCKFYSEALELSTSMTVILPQATETQIGMQNVVNLGKHKTLYLLHGLSDDHSIWLRRTSIERYVAPLGIAVVMPAAHRSFYTDMAYGGAYEHFVAEELPQISRSFFPLSDAREDNYIAGLSMGGYGAFKLALNYPDKYCAAASLSGAVDLASRLGNLENSHRKDAINIFGNPPVIAGTKHDLFSAVQQLKNVGKQAPRLYQCCGTGDFLYDDNLRFRDFVMKEGLPLTWQEDEGYEHSWDYWDLRIQTVLEWMFD